jgi:hypothetical protein
VSFLLIFKDVDSAVAEIIVTGSDRKSRIQAHRFLSTKQALTLELPPVFSGTANLLIGILEAARLHAFHPSSAI